MSASTGFDRTRKLAPARPETENGRKNRWIGLDFSGENDPRRARSLVPLLVLVLIAALGIAALRIDLIRTRYAVAASLEAEKTLMEERRTLIARKRRMRDPTALAVEARDRGFGSPQHVFSIADPEPIDSRPSVSAGPTPDGIE